MSVHPYFVFNQEDVIEVTMLAPLARHFQDWLNERQLHLFRMPDMEGHFGVGINDDHPALELIREGQ